MGKRLTSLCYAPDWQREYPEFIATMLLCCCGLHDLHSTWRNAEKSRIHVRRQRSGWRRGFSEFCRGQLCMRRSEVKHDHTRAERQFA